VPELKEARTLRVPPLALYLKSVPSLLPPPYCGESTWTFLMNLSYV